MHILLVNVAIQMKMSLSVNYKVCRTAEYSSKNHRNGPQKHSLIFIALTNGLLHLNFVWKQFHVFLKKSCMLRVLLSQVVVKDKTFWDCTPTLV
jgi:hypothetical protein